MIGDVISYAPMTLKCSIGSINLPNGDPDDGRYYVRHNGTVRENAFYSNVGKRCGFAPAMARAIGESIFEEISELLQRGFRVELPQMSAYLTMQGKKAAEAKGHASTERRLAVHLQPRGELKDCCKDALKKSLEVDFVTPQASVVVYRVCDEYAEEDGAISNGTNLLVLISGRGLHIPNTSDPTVGVWIEDASGKTVARSKVEKSTVTTLDVRFPKIDLPPGEGYYLCVASRDLMTDAHSVRTVRRRLTILPGQPPPKATPPRTRSKRTK